MENFNKLIKILLKSTLQFLQFQYKKIQRALLQTTIKKIKKEHSSIYSLIPSVHFCRLNNL